MRSAAPNRVENGVCGAESPALCPSELDGEVVHVVEVPICHMALARDESFDFSAKLAAGIPAREAQLETLGDACDERVADVLGSTKVQRRAALVARVRSVFAELYRRDFVAAALLHPSKNIGRSCRLNELSHIQTEQMLLRQRLHSPRWRVKDSIGPFIPGVVEEVFRGLGIYEAAEKGFRALEVDFGTLSSPFSRQCADLDHFRTTV
mmetsp:Transcript_8009/g.14843  ORF Transcript_8009/g.14843 Transcript_8009/m.14843 type:complete len:208 (-) Transcript_8009:250-873(-)